eukprot:5305156-Prymnesium_polylepis.1
MLVNTTATTGDGGGLSIRAGSVTLDGMSMIIGPSAARLGGALFVGGGTTIITSSSILAALAVTGGAFYIARGEVTLRHGSSIVTGFPAVSRLDK